jgi:hypothetical protein
MFQTKKKREAQEEPPQDDLMAPDSWKRLRPGVVNEEAPPLVYPADSRKRKLSDVEPFGAWPPSRSLTDQNDEDDDDEENAGLRHKRVSLDGPMILRLGEKDDDGGGCEMDWEGAAGGSQPSQPERAGYYARAQDEQDYNHAYRDMNRVLYGCFVMRDERK